MLEANGSIVLKKPPAKSSLFTEREREYAALAARTSAAQGTGKRRYHQPKNLVMKPATFVFGQQAQQVVEVEEEPDVIESMLEEVTDKPPVIIPPSSAEESQDLSNKKKKSSSNRKKQSVISNNFAALESNEDDEFICFAKPSFQLPNSFNGNNLAQPAKSPYEAFHAKFKVGGDRVSNTRDRKLSEDEESL